MDSNRNIRNKATTASLMLRIVWSRNTTGVFWCIMVATVLGGSLKTFAQSGATYSIAKSTIGSGGGTSVGTQYEISGTIGQSEAGWISGTNYDLLGGFWSPRSATAPAVPLDDPSGLRKTRFISFSVPDGGGESALRVVMTSLHHVIPPYSGGASVPFTSVEGQVRWVGPPTQYVESNAGGIPFFAARLQCTPHYRNWSTVGLLHVTGSAIVPSSIYDVENLAASCQGNEAGCAAVSAPLRILTTRWGDVRSPYNPPDPSVQPDISDVAALVDKFRSVPGALIKARGLLAGAPGNPFGEITHDVMNVDFGFSHISACVDAFRGVPYPYTISSCP